MISSSAAALGQRSTGTAISYRFPGRRTCLSGVLVGSVGDRAGRSAWEFTAMPAIRKWRRAPCTRSAGRPARASVGGCWAIGASPLYRRDLSPHGRPQTVINFPRRYADACGHRRACTGALLPGWRAGKSRHAYRPHHGRKQHPRSRVRGMRTGRVACHRGVRSNAVDTAILRYCTARRRVRPAPVARRSDARTGLPACCNCLR